MAHLQSCSYCDGHVCDAPWHTECRIAHLEGKLHQLHTIAHGEVQSPGREPDSIRLLGMKQILGDEKWRSKEEFEVQRAAEATRRLEEVLKVGAKAHWLIQQAAEWDRLHPKNKEPVCVSGHDANLMTFTLFHD